MAVRITSSGPRGAKTYEIRWKDGELYDYTDNAYAAKRIAAKARAEERQMRAKYSRKNPTKAQKRLNASKRSKQKRMAVALKKYLQQQNPGMKLAGAKVQRLTGGVLKITPIKSMRGRK